MFGEVWLGPPRHPRGSEAEILAELEAAVRSLGGTES
jgi:hypothetical protein